MPTTSNFGWTTPADTDLVKDGALAIRTLGNGIDTSFLDLKGGTTDQVLAKNSNTDLDFKWVAQDDSNAIQNAIVDAKGDLISATAADTPARLAVGANGTVLTADSTEATGLKWAAPAAAGFVGVSLTRTGADPSFTNNTETVIEWDNEIFDTDGFHSLVTNVSRITIPSGKGGYYYVYGKVDFKENATGARQISIYKNGVVAKKFLANSSGNSERHLQVSCVLSLVATDYLEIYVLQASGGTLGGYTGATNMDFIAQFVGA